TNPLSPVRQRRQLCRHLPFPAAIAGRAGPQSRIPVPYLRHRSGPRSQFSAPIAGFLACVEDAQRLRLPSPPSTGEGLPVCTGPDFKKRKNKNPTERLFSLSFFFSTLETTKTLVYTPSAEHQWRG